VIRITYPEPAVWLDLWGGTSGTFNGFDLFGRIIDQRWQNNVTSSPTDIDRYQYGYDQDSSRIWKANVVGTPVVTGGLDEYYAYDRLNRLTEMRRGTLNGGKTGIIGTPSREMDYTLDPAGNWSAYLTKTAGTTDLNQSRTANPANEITSVTENTGPTWIVPAYDAAGNTTTMPQVIDPTQSFTAVYDAWNRMASISAGGTSVGKYQYDGRNFRIVKLTYTAGVLSQTRHFYYTSNWQDIEQRVGASTSMDQQHVWGARYIDELVCRDDATPERLFAIQDANFNIMALVSAGGSVLQRFMYDPYGRDTVLTASWTATVDSYNWRYRFTCRYSDVESRIYQYRERYYLRGLGRFSQRDPRLYDDGPNLYGYANAHVTTMTDPFGTLPELAVGALAGCGASVAYSLWTSYWSGDNKCQAICKGLSACAVGAIAGALAVQFPQYAGCLLGVSAGTIQLVVGRGCDNYCCNSQTDPLLCTVIGAIGSVLFGCFGGAVGSIGEEALFNIVGALVGIDMDKLCAFAIGRHHG
jgi:RHS repeat-associated protein